MGSADTDNIYTTQYFLYTFLLTESRGAPRWLPSRSSGNGVPTDVCQRGKNVLERVDDSLRTWG